MAENTVTEGVLSGLSGTDGSGAVVSIRRCSSAYLCGQFRVLWNLLTVMACARDGAVVPFE